MQGSFSAIWSKLPDDLTQKLEAYIAEGLSFRKNCDPVLVFFRADDIAVPGNQFVRLINLFAKYRVPLCLAVVPAWFTQPRWDELQRLGKADPSLWCWHQHGFRHVNHEAEGKKQEFGGSRPEEQIRADLVRGKTRLEALMGPMFTPVFTPPWNRCSLQALQILKDLDFKAISRSKGSRPSAPVGLPDFAVNVDLHTRKEPAQRAGWDNLFKEFKEAIASRTCGIMIHHQRMNDASFVFLEILFQILQKQKQIEFVSYNELSRFF